MVGVGVSVDIVSVGWCQPAGDSGWWVFVTAGVRC